MANQAQQTKDSLVTLLEGRVDQISKLLPKGMKSKVTSGEEWKLSRKKTFDKIPEAKLGDWRDKATATLATLICPGYEMADRNNIETTLKTT